MTPAGRASRHSENLDGQYAGVVTAGDAHSRDRHPGGHLDYREQAVEWYLPADRDSDYR